MHDGALTLEVSGGRMRSVVRPLLMLASTSRSCSMRGTFYTSPRGGSTSSSRSKRQFSATRVQAVRQMGHRRVLMICLVCLCWQ